MAILRKAPSRPVALTALLLATIGWGSSNVCNRWLLQGTVLAETYWHGLTLAVLRYALVGALVLPWLVVILYRRRRRVRADALLLLAASLFGAAFLVTFNMGHHYASASLNAVLGQISPVIAFVLGLVVFRERLNLGKGAGLVISCGAAVWYSLVEQQLKVRGDSIPLAGALALAAGVFWALYMIAAKRLMTRWSAMDLSIVTLFASGAMCALAGQLLVPGGLASMAESAASMSPAAWAVVVHLGVVAGLLCYVLFNYGLKTVEASRAAVFGYLLVPAAMGLAVLLPGEMRELPRPSKVVPAAVIIVGVWLVTRKSRAERAGEQASPGAEAE